MTNKEIARNFATLAKLLEIHGENEFKVKSFANASIAVENLPKEIIQTGLESLEQHRGIGKTTLVNIREMMDGQPWQPLEEMIEKTPKGVIELLQIKGLGPKKIQVLWKGNGIDSPATLLNACEQNVLKTIKGFGAKTQENILEKVRFFFDSQDKILWSQAEQLLPDIEKLFIRVFSTSTSAEQGQELKFKILGDYYWQNEIINSFDVVINREVKQLLPSEWILQSETEGICRYKFQDKLFFNFICVSDQDFDEVAFLHSFSAKLRSNIQLEPNALSEASFFEKEKMTFLPNYLRDNERAFALAKENKLPEIISTQDIKGIIHNHSNWSDGRNTIEEMAKACIERGFEYFVLSDHSQTSFYANGLSPERIFAQQEEINKLNETLKPFRIFKSIECDILSEGDLDYDDEVLSSFDLVICSIHQNLDMNEEKAMLRLINAIENPYCSILGHVTGRLLLTRAGYPIDHKKIIDACAANEVVIELNANPKRLDMDYRWIDYAMEKEVMISINPDAHFIQGIDDIRYGVKVAQKAMLPNSMNLSSFGLDEFEDFIRYQHAKRF